MMKKWDGGIPNPIVGFSNTIYVLSKGKGGRVFMSNSNSKNIRMRCIECSNFIMATVHPNGGMSAKCSVCKAVMYSKEHSVNERLIRIIRHSA